MAKYDAYRNRLNASGATHQMDMTTSTKRQAANYILNSPTLSYVSLNRNETVIPSIVSGDKKPFNKRFLFLPDTEAKLGDYVYYEGNHYLATESNGDTIYPELRCELCNWNFKLVVGESKIIVDRDPQGRPIYDTITETVEYPCVLDTKVYSALSNEVMALPAGAMIIKMPHDPKNLVEINYDVQVRNMEYQVTEVNYENVINDIGFIEINLQRVVNKGGFDE